MEINSKAPQVIFDCKYHVITDLYMRPQSNYYSHLQRQVNKWCTYVSSVIKIPLFESWYLRRLRLQQIDRLALVNTKSIGYNMCLSQRRDSIGCSLSHLSFRGLIQGTTARLALLASY